MLTRKLLVAYEGSDEQHRECHRAALGPKKQSRRSSGNYRIVYEKINLDKSAQIVSAVKYAVR